MRAIGVLVPPLPGGAGQPDERPIGRAARQLEQEGIPIVFGYEAVDGALSGVRARAHGWEPVRDVPVVAVYDRFPARSRADVYAGVRQGLGDVPIANPPAIVELCADKVRCQRVLSEAGIPQPAIQPVAGSFEASLAAWGEAFLKPRYGAFGRGVRRVVPGDPLPAEVEGAVPGVAEPTFLQRAVPAPGGWAGVSCRVLVQRQPTRARAGPGDWWVAPPVARRHRHDPVVNAARGAEVVSLEGMAPGIVRAVQELALRSAAVLAAQPGGDLVVELGVDVVLDPGLQPWVIEVNSRPRGRLEVLAAAAPDRYGALHVEACGRPLRFLAARYR